VTEAQFSVAHDTTGPLVIASGQLDLAVNDALRDVLAGLDGTVTIDLSEVTFIDSSAIGVLVGAQTRLTDAGGGLRLRNPQDLPRRVLEIVGFGEWIES
jgi:anti-sigma B factor antagonist